MKLGELLYNSLMHLMLFSQSRIYFPYFIRTRKMVEEWHLSNLFQHRSGERESVKAEKSMNFVEKTPLAELKGVNKFMLDRLEI